MPRRSAFLMETKRNESREKNIFIARRRRRPETYIGTPSGKQNTAAAADFHRTFRTVRRGKTE
jgi:hypothetical protein